MIYKYESWRRPQSPEVTAGANTFVCGSCGISRPKMKYRREDGVLCSRPIRREFDRLQNGFGRRVDARWTCSSSVETAFIGRMDDLATKYMTRDLITGLPLTGPRSASL